MSDRAAPDLRRILAATRELLEGLRSGEVPPTELSARHEARRALLATMTDLTEVDESDRCLAAEIQKLDQQILTWCQRAIGETRDHLARARRSARRPVATTARLVSESA